MTSLTEEIRARLTEALTPERLEVLNESHLHARHQPGFDGTGDSQFRTRIVSPLVAGMKRLARHRAVTDLLKGELERGLHALAIEAAAPGEATRW